MDQSLQFLALVIGMGVQLAMEDFMVLAYIRIGDYLTKMGH